MDETYWGLSGRPFQLTPDPRFWYETATHRKAMTYLGYGLAQGEGFIVITGDIGAGKTTLVGHLVETLDRQRLDPIKIVSTAIEADDLLRIVAGQLGGDPAGLTKAELLVAIERGLHGVARTGRRTLLVVDEAQALPVSALEELRMLSNFQAGGHALLQIVLLGQPEFRDRLHGSDRLEQLRQRIIAIHHLDPMGEDEVADYLAHRLTVVGWTGRPDFADDAFAAFHAGSGGVPRRLNLLAARVMLHAAVERLELIDGAAVRQVARDLHADLPTMAEPMEEVEPTPEPQADEPSWLVVAGEAADDQTDPEAPRRPGLVPGSTGPQEPHAEALAAPWMSEPFRHDEEEEGPIAAAPAPSPADDLADRIAQLEGRVEEQEEALRRVLTLLVDWIEADERPAAPTTAAQPVPIRGAAWTDAA